MLTKNEVIEKCIDVHGDKYDYSITDGVANVNCKIKYICKKHGVVEQILSNHLKGRECLKCSYEKRRFSKTISKEEFIRRAEKTHDDLDAYDFSNLDLTKRDEKNKIDIQCKTHGVFKMRIDRFINGQNCPFCSNLKKDDYKVREELQKLHKNLDFSNTFFSKRDSKNNILVTCPKHGEKKINYYNLLSGQGCRECGIERSRILQTMDKETFLKKIYKLYGDRYDVSNTDLLNKENGKIKVICKKHGEFEPYFNNFMSGHGCPKCNQSKLEAKIENYLKDNHIEYEYQKKFEWLGRQSLDFYIPELNLAIECQGEQHYRPIKFFGGVDGFNKTVIRDTNKRKLCEEHNIKLIYYSYNEENINIW